MSVKKALHTKARSPSFLGMGSSIFIAYFLPLDSVLDTLQEDKGSHRSIEDFNIIWNFADGNKMEPKSMQPPVIQLGTVAVHIVAPLPDG